MPRLLQFMIDEGIRPRALDMILLGAFWMFIAAMIGAASTLGQGYCRAVDMETEYKIQAALAELAAETTTFIIAQRITSVVGADQILVLDHGRIAERGTHQQLLQQGPIYREIYESQLGEVARANGRGVHTFATEEAKALPPSTQK